MIENNPGTGEMAKYKSICMVSMVIICIWPLHSEANDKTRAAKEAAGIWLELVDEGHYAMSWDTAAGYFQGAMGKEQWHKALSAIRKPLGRAVSRDLIGARYYTSLPGAPDGEYVVIQYRTRFDHKASAIETVTPMKDTDGQWRVSGYYIK